MADLIQKLSDIDITAGKITSDHSLITTLLINRFWNSEPLMLFKVQAFNLAMNTFFGHDFLPDKKIDMCHVTCQYL